MNMSRPVPRLPDPAVPDARGRIRRPMSILHLLQWAFADECASVDFEDPGTLAQGYRGIGTEYLLIQRCIIGCQIDGGGRSDPDPDADLVASALAMLPEGCGGRRMAVWIAEMSRARTVPDTYAGVTPSCQPVAWRENQHGPRAVTESLGITTDVSGRKPKRFDMRVCPVRFVPAPDQIASARRAYLQWWLALLDMRTTFQIHNNLSRWTVTDAMPPKSPWKKRLAE